MKQWILCFILPVLLLHRQIALMKNCVKIRLFQNMPISHKIALLLHQALQSTVSTHHAQIQTKLSSTSKLQAPIRSSFPFQPSYEFKISFNWIFKFRFSTRRSTSFFSTYGSFIKDPVLIRFLTKKFRIRWVAKRMNERIYRETRLIFTFFSEYPMTLHFVFFWMRKSSST